MPRRYDTARNAYQPPLLLRGHSSPIRSVAFLGNGKEVISGSEDSSVRRWRVEDGHEVGRVMWEKGGVLAVAASSDGQWIATADGGNSITIWNTTTHENVVELEGHSDCVRSLAFSPDSVRVASGSKDKTVMVWSTTTGKRLLNPLEGHKGTVRCARFSPEGDKIASCDYDDVRIWNSDSGDLVIRRIKIKALVALSLIWSPDGRQLIAGCGEGYIKCIDSSTGELLADWKAHTALVYSVAVSPNGKFVASASDKTVRLWDMTSHAHIRPTLQCDDKVYSVAISPDGTHLVSGGRDNRVRIWSLQRIVPPRLLEDMPMTLSVTARPNGLLSNQSVFNPVHQQVLSSLEEHRSEPPPAPPEIITNGQGKDLGDLGLLGSDGDASSDSSIMKISTAREPQLNLWNLDDIHSSFPNDLTGSVKQEGEHPIASGSYGDIYRATLRVRGKSTDVAVKAIRTYSAGDGDDVGKKRLNREIRVWLNLKHINVLPLFGTTMGFGLFPAMVCPWLEDGPLTSYLARRCDSLTTVERLVLVGDVAVGLEYLHSQTVVHGDLSGSNVLIQPNGRACISDFGMSTLLTELGGSTFATSLHPGGTLRWVAPELLDLQVSENEENPPKIVPTQQSDIYSFGAIMLQVLTGKVPYNYYSREGQVLHAISKREIPKRPNKALITDGQWSFLEWCWAAVYARPSDDEIVEFTRNELVHYVLPQV